MATNKSIQLMASAARTATNNSGDKRNAVHRGIRVHIKVTADPAAASVTYTLQGKDNITGDYYTLLASAPVAAVGDTFLHVYPGIAEVANQAKSAVLPPYWRLLATHADGDSMTYQCTAELLV